MFYASNSTPHRTLTEQEQRQLLKVTGERRDGYRDHVLYSMALATGLREHELTSLEVGDVFEGDGAARKRIVLRVFKGGTGTETQEVIVPLTSAPSWKSSGDGRSGRAKASRRTRPCLRAIEAHLYQPGRYATGSQCGSDARDLTAT